MQERHFDIVISGASFAGLALARGLSLAFGGAIAIALVDRAAGPPSGADTRAFAIWAGAKNVLDALGVWSALEVVAEPITTIEITDSGLDDGMRPALLTYPAVTADGAIAGFIVPSAALHTALYEALASAGNVSWIAPAEAVGYSTTPTGADIALADGQRLHATVVVAAEGRASRLRDSAGIKTVGWSYAQRGIVATVQFSEPHYGTAIQHFLPGGPFAILPLKGNRACITWSARDDEAQRVLALDDAAFLCELDKRIGGRFGDITLIDPPQSWPLDLKIARRFIAPRFALIGDAAHGVHPIAGNGVNLALRDVAALVECMTDAARIGLDIGNADTLERYERWRRFDTTMSAAAYDGLNRLFAPDNVLLRAARGVGLGLVDRMSVLKTLIIEEAAGLTGDTPRMLKGERI